MKRLVLIISAILSLAILQAQIPVTDGYLTDGDIVSISTIDSNKRYYLEASTSGIKTQENVTDNCLWQIGIIKNGDTFNYTFKDLTTGKSISINEKPNNPSYSLQNNPTVLRFQREGEENNKQGICEYGKLYHYFYYSYWWRNVSIYFAQGGWNPFRFTVSTSNEVNVYIEKWEQKGAGKPTGHFNPSKIEFSYIGDQEGEAETDDDPRNVQFMIEATTESYYQCVNRPEEALLRRQTNDVDVDNITINNIYWQSTGDNKGKSSNLDVSKYVAYQDVNRTLMTVSDPETTTGGEQKTWQFTVTPIGASPMGLKDKLGTLERWIDYADNVIVEYTYGNGEVQKAEMRVVRKSYHEEQLPYISFFINPVTYTYSIEEETKQFDVTLTHQHGSVIYNMDHQAIDSSMTYGPVHVKLNEFHNHFKPEDKWEKTYRFRGNGGGWLQLNETEFKSNGNIYITASTNTTGFKRTDTIVITLEKTAGELAHLHKDSFMIPLSQRGQVGGIQFKTQQGKGNNDPNWKEGDEQQVHTAERTIYYLPNQEIELRLPESGYSGYMRWYDYETNGDPYYNENPVDSTDWIRSPRAANGNAFSAINTPRNALEATIQQEGVSLGLYALNKASRGGVLDEGNPSNPAPILKGWNYDPDNPATAHHIMACDVSAYTDYRIVYNTTNTARIDTIQEPTLSYRQLFHLRPASEIADTLAARSKRREYLENYKYLAPAGKQILLSTEYRHSKVRSHESELCYFYKDNGGNVHRIDNRQGNMLKWYVSDKIGTREYTPEENNNNPIYIAEMDYLIVRSDNYYDAPKVYTLVMPANSEHPEYLIARFEVEYVDIEQQGPTSQTIITQQRIDNQYKPLAKINFDDKTTHLDWDEASYGYVYTTGPLATQFKRGADQGAFPFYGEYMLTTGVDKDWARESAHGGQGQSLYVDGTMEPGLVATISASGQICSGQTMYCSAWFCNPAPSRWSGEGNPIFRCNIQGKNEDEDKWHDVGVYFVGELLKGSKWQQVVFPIQSKESYDRIRVSIYNFATTNQGNDFMVDDINLFVSQLPIAAYQGKMACRSIEDGETTAAAVLRIDYNNITAGSDGYMYYQIYNESYDDDKDGIADGAPVNLTGDASYYHDYDVDHGDDDYDHPYGSVHIPEQGFDPEAENNKSGIKTYPIASSVSAFLDSLVQNNLKHGKVYIKVNNDGATKWLLYVAHILNNTDEADQALVQLYEPHDYVMRMAYTPEELPTAECNLTTPLHATQQTVFKLRNSNKETIKHSEGKIQTANSGEAEYILEHSTENCANDLYFLTSTVINHLALETGGTPVNIAAPIYSDWLIGDPVGDVLSEQAPVRANYATDDAYNAALNDYNNRLQASIEGFKDMYGGYTHDQVATAIMYDMRRVPTSKDNNPNYTARTFQELDRNAFLSHQNYEIVRHLYENGWLQLCDTTVHFYLGSRLNKNEETIRDTVRYWCFPIEGTAKKTVKVDGVDTEITLKDCNEPHRVMVSITRSGYYYNITPIEYAKKTPQQSVQLPTLKVLEGSTNITFPVTELGGSKTAGQTTDDGKTSITLDLNSATYINLETGEPYPTKPELVAGNKYTIRLTLLDQYTSKDGSDQDCRYGYVFLNLEIVPKTLVWQPAETAFNGWGKNENWKGWVDSNHNDKIDEGEICNGYVPMEEADVIIPNINNDLLYPYIVPEHEHNHYPLTINTDPHHCKNIYFAPGAKIHNQHLLQYDKAFVDMQITAGGWNMVSAPMKGMVSGDMFIPHDGMYYDNDARKIEEPQHFVVSEFKGTRSTNAVYAFWEGFYNTTVEKMTNNGVVHQTASAEFISSNTLAQPLTPGTGYQLWGEGKTSQEVLTIRLPKPDKSYDYYTREQPNGQSVNIPQNLLDVRGQLAFDSNHDEENAPMTIELTNKVPSQYFLFGNPTMAYIDMHALFVDNSTSNWTGSFLRMENSISMPIAQLTMAEDRYLPPMTSALLECSKANTSMTIQLKPSHLTLNNLVNPTKQADGDNTNSQSISARRVAAYESERPENEDAQATEMLTIYALTENAHARTVLATNPIANDYYQIGEDALFISTGVENQSVVISPLNMYTVAEQVPMMADVRQGISNIPVAILAADNARSEYMQVAFYYTSNWSRECYFCDSKTGQKIRIMDGLVISVEMPQNHEQRYYIEGPDTYQGSNGVVTSTTQPTLSTTGNKVWAYAPDRGNVVVSSSDLIKSATLYDITGRLITSSPLNSHLMTNSLTLHTVGTAGVYIVDVTLRDGSTERAQVIVP